MEVKILRLITGEEIIAEIIGQDCPDPNSYAIKNPMIIGLTDEGLGTAPLSMLAVTKELNISKAHVLFAVPPEEEILNAYKTKFGGIVLAKGLV